MGALFFPPQASHIDIKFLCVAMYTLPTSVGVKSPQETSLFKFRFLGCTHEYLYGKWLSCINILMLFSGKNIAPDTGEINYFCGFNFI